MRRASYLWPPRQRAKDKAKIGRGQYKCAECGKVCKPAKKVSSASPARKAEFHLDHKEPVVPVDSEGVDWNVYIERLFVDVEGWQVLCVDCHKIKTDKENKERKYVRKFKGSKE